MILYTSQTSSRLKYIIYFIEGIISEAIFITTDKDYFLQSSDSKINYTNSRLCTEEYHIKPHGLLFENTVENIKIEVSIRRNNFCFFINENDSHGFDVFAAAFYLISRYEEYLPHEKDSYGRYAHINSLAWKNGFLHLPLVNFWLKDLVNNLSTVNRQPSTEYLTPITKKSQHQTPVFTFIPTYDIDIAYAHKHQLILKNVAGFFKDLMQGNLEKVIERASVYSGQSADPFDVYDWLNELHKKQTLQPIYFFLLAEKRGTYDKNISPKANAIKCLIHQHAEKYNIGIHPSWQSGDKEKLLKQEINQLVQITQKPCTISRQHYIRFTLPETYRNLISEKIEADYSMGYGTINGFRASVASPFFWYDLETETQTNLLVHSFCYMDATCIFQQHISPSEALQALQQYLAIVKSVNGEFIIIHHNNFLTLQPQFIEWRNMYEKFLTAN